MDIVFSILDSTNIDKVVALVYDLNQGEIEQQVLKSRFVDMFHQNYECAGIFDNDKLIGVAGLWFCTRHYSGKSVELDHVYIVPDYRNKGLGKQFMDWMTSYCIQKGCEAIELNTYVNNYPSHKFYYNEGMEILGYHFVKRL